MQEKNFNTYKVNFVTRLNVFKFLNFDLLKVL